MRPVIAAALLLAAACTAEGADWGIDWQRFDIDAHLDNSGAVQVIERTSVQLAGGMSVLKRKLAPGIDQRIEITRFLRRDGGNERELAVGSDYNVDQYEVQNGELSWRIKADEAPDWDGQALEFVLEYRLRNAIAPVWDIPAGSIRLDRIWTFPEYWSRWQQTIAAWRELRHGLDRRYRFDHDIVFPQFPANGPAELHYTLRHDDAWSDPNPGASFGIATPESDYRVTVLRDYRRAGWPPAIELWRPAVRVGSIAISALGALLLWLIYAVGEIRARGFIAQRTGRAWFEEHIASQRPEVLVWFAGVSRGARQFPQFLARLRKAGTISVETERDPNDSDGFKLHLRRTGNDSKLRPYEQAVLKELFPDGPETDSAKHEAAHSEDGFDPEDVLADAVTDEFEDETPPPRPTPLFRRWLRIGLPVLFFGGIALVILDIVQTKNIELLESGLFIGLGLVIFAGLAALVPKPNGSGVTAVIVLGIILLLLLGEISMQFFTVLPLGPAGSAGMGALTLWCVATLLIFARQDAPSSPVEQIVMRGKRYVRRELRRAQPALDDAWIPQICALGCLPDLDRWQRRRTKAASNPLSRPTLPGVAPQLQIVQPFTGTFPSIPEDEWVEELHILSAEDRRELEEDEREDAKNEDDESEPGG